MNKGVTRSAWLPCVKLLESREWPTKSTICIHLGRTEKTRVNLLSRKAVTNRNQGGAFVKSPLAEAAGYLRTQVIYPWLHKETRSTSRARVGATDKTHNHPHHSFELSMYIPRRCVHNPQKIGGTRVSTSEHHTE